MIYTYDNITLNKKQTKRYGLIVFIVFEVLTYMGYYLFIIFYPIIIIKIDSLEPQLFIAVVTVAVGC